MFRIRRFGQADGLGFQVDVDLVVAGSFWMAAKSFWRKSSLTVTGSRKLFRALFLKISAKKLLTTTSNPASLMAQAACSRLEPQPKFLPPTRIFPLIGRVVQDKIFFGRVVAVIAPVAEEVVAKSVAAGGFQEAGGDDLVGVDVFQVDGDCGGIDFI